LLKKGAVPTLFTRSSSPVRTGLWRRRRIPPPLKQDPVPTGFQHQEHDYCSSLVQDHLEVDETEVLRKEFERLKRQVALSVLQRFCLGRFAASDDDIRFYTSWASFLYAILGSVRIWMSEEAVKAHMPKEFQNYPDTHVVIDCIELRCKTPTSLLLQGSVSDKELLKQSGIVSFLKPEMAIMVKK
ncbi:hypothetical protein cypCar_00009461, partial [Cyprinus carpio]